MCFGWAQVARLPRISIAGMPQHIIQRGNNREACFLAAGDYRLYLKSLKLASSKHGCLIHAYVLMSNHFHLLAETPHGNLSEFMRHFNITYTSYFNRRYKRSGNLYQGRFKSFLIVMGSNLYP